MAITAIARDFNDVPNIVRVVATDTLAQVAAANYILGQAANLAVLNAGTWEWLVGDVVLVQASDGDQFFNFAGADFTTLITLPGGNGAVTLPVVDHNFVNFDGTLGALEDLGFSASDATKTKVVMAGSAVQANYIAHFIDTAGTIDDTAANIQNDGNIQAGKSGTAGTLISFPVTAAKGSLILAAVNNTGNTNTTISNAAMGQASVISIPDPGAATSDFVLAQSAIPTNQVTFTVVKTATAAALATAGKVNLIVHPTATAQFAIIDIKVLKSTGLSGGGGDRLLAVSDGTIVFNNAGITAALLGTPILTLWGGTGNPLAVGASEVSTAGADIFLQYTGGATDYTAGSVQVAVTMVQVTA